MKAEFGDLIRSFGEVRLFPESIDDLWHMSHLISPDDLVFATTLRTTETQADKIRPEKAEKRPVRLGIRVTRVEFHDFALRLRVSGVIEQGVARGTHQPLKIVGVLQEWERHSPEALKTMLDSLADLKRRGLAIIEE